MFSVLGKRGRRGRRGNELFENIEFEKIERPLLYRSSFQGAYDSRWYLTNIRDKIFNMKHPNNCFINRIE